MASEYKQASDIAISSLVSDLVTLFIEEEPGSDNHELAVDFCVRNIRRHNFADVNPSEVDRNFAGVERQLGIASQLAKQAALAGLRARLMALPLSASSAHPEPHHRLLCLLFYLQRKPLDSVYVAPSKGAAELRVDVKCTTEENERRIVVELLRRTMDNSAGDGAFDSDSELSDWGSDSEGGAGSSDNGAAEGPADTPLAGGDEQEDAGGSPAPLELLPPQPASSKGTHLGLVHPGHPGNGTLHAASSGLGGRRLVDCVLEARGGGLPLPGAWKGSQSLATEPDLMWEALRALRGIPGKTITRSGEGGALSVDPLAHTEGLLCSSLHALLQDFVDAGNAMLHAREAISQATLGSLDGPASGASPATPTVAALCVQIEGLLENCCSAMLPLETELAAQHSGRAAAAGARRLTLLQLRAKAVPIIEELLLLGAITAAVMPTERLAASRITPAEATCSVLSGLYAMLEATAAYDEPRREAVLLRLLVGALEPYLRMLQIWLTQGIVHSSWEDFLVVQQSDDISVTSSDFWPEAFRMRQPGPDARSTVPSFLEPLAQQILSAGKAVHLMANVDTAIAQLSTAGEEGRRKRVLAASAAAAADCGHTARGLRSTTLTSGPDGSFFGSFMALVTDTLSSAPRAAERPPLAEAVQPLLRPVSTASSARHRVQALPSDPKEQPAVEPQGRARQRGGGEKPGLAAVGCAALPSVIGAAELGPSLSSAVLPPLLDADSAEWSTWVEGSKGSVACRALPVPRVGGATQAGGSDAAGNCSRLVRIAPFQGVSQELQRLGHRSAAPPKGAAGGRWSPPAAVLATRDLAWISSAPGVIASSRAQEGGAPETSSGPGRLPPPRALLEKCLLEPLRQQVEHRGMELLGQLLGPWGLNEELRVLRGFFLMATPALEGFITELFPLLTSGAPGLVQRVPAYEIEALVKGSIPPEHCGEPLPDQDRITVEVDKGPELQVAEQAALERSLPCMHSLDRLKIKYKVTTPLEMILDHKALDAYSSALTFLLQVRWAMQALDNCRMALYRRIRANRRGGHQVQRQRPTPKSGTGLASKPLAPPQNIAEFLDRAELFRDLQEMLHYSTNLHRFVLQRNLFSAFANMEKDLDEAATLDDVIAAHARFVSELEVNCLFREKGPQAKYIKLMKKGVNLALNHIVQWCHILSRLVDDFSDGAEGKRAISAAASGLAHQKAEYDKAYRFSLNILRQATSVSSGFYGLEQLRIHLEY